MNGILENWGRRAFSIPLYLVLWVVAVGGLPVLLPATALVDLIRKSPWAASRCLLFFALYLTCEIAGVLLSFLLWLVGGPWRGGDRTIYLGHNFRLQCWWARALFGGARRIFGLSTRIEGEDVVQKGPFLLFVRHASVGDTVLPAVFISSRHDLVLRYVLKRELLWDPCLDIVGNRLPNCFVRRGSGEGEREVARVKRLAADLGPNEGILIYPEGTRFTAAKQKAILKRLDASGSHSLLTFSRQLRHVLPPRLGGPLGLLEAAPDLDVVFLAHTGFEGAGTFTDLANGELVGKTIHVAFRRVPRDEIPVDRAGRVEWLLGEWKKIDEWIDEKKRGPEVG